MQTDIRNRLGFFSVLLLVLFGFVSTSSFAETSNNGPVDSYSFQWPMAMWYVLSIILALIGFMKARSKS